MVIYYYYLDNFRFEVSFFNIADISGSDHHRVHVGPLRHPDGLRRLRGRRRGQDRQEPSTPKKC